MPAATAAFIIDRMWTVEAIVPEAVARSNPDVVVREIEVDVKRPVGLAYRAARFGCFAGLYRETREATPRAPRHTCHRRHATMIGGGQCDVISVAKRRPISPRYRRPE